MKRRHWSLKFALAAVFALCDLTCREDSQLQDPTVVVYTAVDQHYAQPVLEDFERSSGVRVAAVYDTEASKTTGLVSRLLSERRRPRADVFWNNEVAQTIALKQQDLLARYVPPGARKTPKAFRDPDGYWVGVAARARVIVYNTELVPADSIPRSITDLLRPDLQGRVAVAYPLFGTTRTHAAALFALWGDDRASEFFRKLIANGVRFVDGNATVRNMVAQGTVHAGLTDTDDVHVGMLRGNPIAMVFPDQNGEGTLVIPTTVCMVAKCPHPEESRQLIDFLVSDRVERMLAASEAAYLPLRPGVAGPPDLPAIGDIKTLPLDYGTIAKASTAASAWFRENIER